MLVRRLVLHNIRSYADAAIDFPEGIVLLAGDIGAGKSTILLAIEFALFGIQRGELSGSALLRHGETQGWVELSLEVEKKQLVIVRQLRRGNGSVTQEGGYLLQDGLREDCTALELKAKVLVLLGYPQDLLTKGRSLLFRYTVYTPQEEMKRILEESPEERLMTLRRLFGIEKYERIQGNARIVMQSLKEKSKELDGVLSQLPQRTAQLVELARQHVGVEQELQVVLPSVEVARRSVEEARARIRESEEKLNTLFAVKREMATIEAQQRVQKEQQVRLERELAPLQLELTKPQPVKADVMDAPTRAARRVEAEQSIIEIERALSETRSQIAVIGTRVQLSKELVRSISALDVCPTCKQGVPHEHRSRIVTDEEGRVAGWTQERSHVEVRLGSLTQQLAQQRQQLESVRQQDQQAALAVMQQKLFDEKKARFAAYSQQMVSVREALSSLAAQQSSCLLRLDGLAAVEELHKQLMRRLEAAQQEERAVAIKHARLAQQKETLVSQHAAVQKEIAALEQQKVQREGVAKMRGWVSDAFVPLVADIESHVLAAVHRSFNALFVNWFSLLIDDPVLSARIGRDFGVVLQQNGYDTAFENMSGGERTATALAYRLALAQVVNDMVSIATRDLLILDEPTDGFSSEQLEKVRDVLRELRCRQVLLVSHEVELEGFVDKVIRVEKREHESAISI